MVIVPVMVIVPQLVKALQSKCCVLLCSVAYGKCGKGGQTESFQNVGGQRCIKCINFSKV